MLLRRLHLGPELQRKVHDVNQEPDYTQMDKAILTSCPDIRSPPPKSRFARGSFWKIPDIAGLGCAEQEQDRTGTT